MSHSPDPSAQGTGCLHEPVPDGAEVLGELDGEEDAGDEEEGAGTQAEPEGVLE